MSCCDDCTNCASVRERLRYFPRQLLGVADMVAEQEHRLARARWHNRMLHGWGVTCGLTVARAKTAQGAVDENSTLLTVCSGYALSPQGDEIIVEEPLTIDVTTGLVKPDPCADSWPCPPAPSVGQNERIRMFLAIRYAECLARPVQTPAGCGCDEGGCDYSRTRSSHELRLLASLPQSHADMLKAEAAFVAQWKARDAQPQENLALIEGHGNRAPVPTPPCPPCPADPWVVLAEVVLSVEKSTVRIALVSEAGRRVLLPAWAIQALAAQI